jgi:hypothetical protein
LIKIFENIAVVTIDAPLNIIYVDPEINDNPIYCKMDEQQSAIAGIINILAVCGIFPFYN